ncbi:MAG: hypothetical protein GVY30_06705 [Chloroflexi bacterium]|jgi:hypothetical protein|nr:hypothetical protein [Chloroflexota bacterium]
MAVGTAGLGMMRKSVNLFLNHSKKHLVWKVLNFGITIAPLFSTFSLIAHATVGAERTVEELQATLRFSMLSIYPT